jgi:ATP diphosphatase
MPLERLVAIMRRLRDPVSGCEWDREQSFATIAPYTIEEAYEVADAIARDDMDALADELGDLQLQVVFHAQMAQESGHFTLDDVVDRICNKMERRHPHIFGDVQHGGQHLWEAIKAEERSASPDKSALAGVALALPALDAETDHQRKLEELGDLLFAVVNLARHLNIEPEAALREANGKFEKRFRAIEDAPGFAQMSLDEKEELWAAVKAAQAVSSA